MKLKHFVEMLVHVVQTQCDVIFISEELADRIKDRAQVPVVAIKNFMNKKEVEEKTLVYLEENCK